MACSGGVWKGVAWYHATKLGEARNNLLQIEEGSMNDTFRAIRRMERIPEEIRFQNRIISDEPDEGVLIVTSIHYPDGRTEILRNPESVGKTT